VEANADSLHDPPDVDAKIRRHVLVRARELGSAPRPEDVQITWAGLETPPGARLFRAQWPDRSGERALTGVWVDGDVNSRPLEAIELLLRRWRDSMGDLPDAGIVACVCAFLLDADCRHRILAGPVEEWPEAIPAPLRPFVHAARFLGAQTDLPLAFWWLDGHGRLLRVQIGRNSDGRIEFEVIPLQDFKD
jgi:hypothetical protein